MTDEALKRAYRQLTASGRAASIDADALAALASGDVKSDERDARLSAVAESTQNADLLRVVRALEADANNLSADVQRMRQPIVRAKRTSAPLRWLAVAASLAMAGLIGLALRSPVIPDESSAVQTAQTQAEVVEPVNAETSTANIMMASFESRATSKTPPSIFVGDFDS